MDIICMHAFLLPFCLLRKNSNVAKRVSILGYLCCRLALLHVALLILPMVHLRLPFSLSHIRRSLRSDPYLLLLSYPLFVFICLLLNQ
jgi:hypothetical protein